MQRDQSDRLRLTEAASEYGRHPDTLRRWIQQQRLTGELVGNIWYVSRQDVERVAGPSMRADLQQLRREFVHLSQRQERMQRELTATKDALYAQDRIVQLLLQRLAEAGISVITDAPSIKPAKPKKMPILRYLAEHGIPIGTSKGWPLPVETDGRYDKAHVLTWALHHIREIGYRGRRVQPHRCTDLIDVCVTLLPPTAPESDVSDMV